METCLAAVPRDQIGFDRDEGRKVGVCNAVKIMA